MANPIEHCKECVDLLGEYIEGSLPRERAEALEAHLSLCMPCITFVRTYKATRKLCRHRLAAQMPSELVASLQSFLAQKISGFPCAKPGAAEVTSARAEPEAQPGAPKKA